MSAPLLTIGHGYEGPDAFAARLLAHRVQMLVDVRSFPGSRRSPHFGREQMPTWLAQAGIDYRHTPALGGRRRPSKTPIPSDGWWRVESFANYAAHTRTADWLVAFEDLLELAERTRVAIMCGEPGWWRCHRRMISDVATDVGVPVWHIMPNGALQRHEASEWAACRHDDQPEQMEIAI